MNTSGASKLVVPIQSSSINASREAVLHAQLSNLIAEGRWTAGQRLPAERLLCEEFEVSRNTVRSVLKKLEASGVVQIKRGSGCYLADAANGTQENTSDKDSAPVLMEKLEAAYLFLPPVFVTACHVISSKQITQLEECTGKIGRAILDHNWPALRRNSEEFFALVSGALQNAIIRDVSCSICASSSFLFPRFDSFAEEDRNKMFADFVLVLKALKARDTALMEKAVKVKILNVAVALARLRGIALSPIIAAEQHSLAPP